MRTPPTEDEIEKIRRSFKRCRAGTLDAIIGLQQSGGTSFIPAIVRGIVWRYVQPEAREVVDQATPEMNAESMPMRVTHARTGTLETDLPNQRVLMHLYDARYQQRDENDPHDLRKIRDGISLKEGTLPISLAELYAKTRRPGRSAQSLKQLIDQLAQGTQREQSANRTEISKRFSFPFSCIAFALVGVPLGITAHRRETSVDFGFSLLVAFSYFLFIIAPTRSARTRARIPSCSFGCRMFSSSASAQSCSGS